MRDFTSNKRPVYFNKLKKKKSVSSGEDESEDLSSDSEDEETVEVNGFRVLVSQEDQVKKMFKDHPNLSTEFKLANQKLKNAYMDVLLDVIDTLTNPAYIHSLKDLDNVDSTLSDLTKAGFKLDWLRQIFDETYLKKEEERVNGAKIKELEKLIEKRKLNLSNLESDLKKEKAVAAFAAKRGRIGSSKVV